MPIESFNLQVPDRKISVSEDGSIEVAEKYIAVLDTAETNPNFIINDALVPRQGSEHPEWQFLRLSEIDANSHSDSRKVWVFELKYSTNAEPLEANSQERTFDPDRFDNEAKIRVRWSFGTEKRVIERARMFMGTHKYEEETDDPPFNTYDRGTDNQGYMPMNSAGQLFSPAMTYDHRYPIATVDRNELVVPTALFNYVLAINSDAFVIDSLPVAKYVCRMLDISVSERKRDRNVSFRTVTYKLGFKPLETVKIQGPLRTQAAPEPSYFNSYQCSGWDAVAVDAGLYERDYKNNKLAWDRNRDEKGNPSTKPQYLDGKGKFLNMSDVTLVNNPTAEQIAEWIRYRRYMYLTPLPFAPFNFY